MIAPGSLSKLAFPAILLAAMLVLHAGTPTNQIVLLDLDGRTANPFNNRDAKLLAFIFVRTDCPISNAYAPEIQRLQSEFTSRGVAFSLVYPDADATPATIRRHLHEFRLSCSALRDPHHTFAAQSHVTITPEAAIFRPDGTLLYHGRIDDRYVDFGKARPTATRHDLADTLTLALSGQPIPTPTSPAIGCFIEDVK